MRHPTDSVWSLTIISIEKACLRSTTSHLNSPSVPKEWLPALCKKAGPSLRGYLLRPICSNTCLLNRQHDAPVSMSALVVTPLIDIGRIHPFTGLTRRILVKLASKIVLCPKMSDFSLGSADNGCVGNVCVSIKGNFGKVLSKGGFAVSKGVVTTISELSGLAWPCCEESKFARSRLRLHLGQMSVWLQATLGVL